MLYQTLESLFLKNMCRLCACNACWLQSRGQRAPWDTHILSSQPLLLRRFSARHLPPTPGNSVSSLAPILPPIAAPPQVGSKVMVLPGHEVAMVKNIEVGGQPAQVARAGDSADLALSGIPPENLAVGGLLCHALFPAPLVTKFEARVVTLDITVPVLKGAACSLHAHVLREAGVVSGLLSLLDGKSGEVLRQRPRCLTKNQTAVVEITAARPIAVEEYADYAQLGRVALRDGGRTIAVGVITKLVA